MATYGTWVPISTPPTEDGLYLYHCLTADPASPLIHIGWYTPGNGWTFVPSYWAPHITHWMPLPDPPTLTAGTPTGHEPSPRGGYF